MFIELPIAVNKVIGVEAIIAGNLIAACITDELGILLAIGALILVLLDSALTFAARFIRAMLFLSFGGHFYCIH